jgi:hypothetical protein
MPPPSRPLQEYANGCGPRSPGTRHRGVWICPDQILQATWDRSLPQLKTDPRFALASLPVNQQVHLFHAYVEQLRSKYQSSLAALFETHAPSLASPFSSLPIPYLLTSLPVTKLGLDIGALEAEFERWQRGRTTQARNEFDQMLGESSFIEFWGRLGKIGGEGVEGGIKADDLGEDEGEGGGGKVDMKQLAKTIDVEEIEKVLRVSLCRVAREVCLTPPHPLRTTSATLYSITCRSKGGVALLDERSFQRLCIYSSLVSPHACDTVTWSREFDTSVTAFLQTSL